MAAAGRSSRRATGRPTFYRACARLAVALLASYLLSTAEAAGTQADDAGALLQLKAQYNISTAWSGSTPCAAVGGWSHVTCCYDASAQLRVCGLGLVDLQLQGPLPNLSNLTELRDVDLSFNQLTGSMPSSLLNPKLTRLALSNNLLQGNWTDSMAALCTATPQLQVLDLSSNLGLGGSLPGCWGQLSMLKELRLAMTSVEGTLPSAWGSLQQLEHLDLSFTQWQPQPVGAWPVSWGNMSSLHYLDLSGSTGYTSIIIDPLPIEWLAPSIPPPVYTGMDLTHFICHHCQWSMAADAGFQGQPHLTWLDISSNPLAAPNTLPSQWDGLPLETLKARNCGLSMVPPATGSNFFSWTDVPGKLLSTLRVLDLGENPALSSDLSDPMSRMQLWELYIDGTSIGDAGPGWAHLPCILNTTGNTIYDGTLPQDASLNGICRTNATAEWEMLSIWNENYGLGMPWTLIPPPPGAPCPYAWGPEVTCDSETGRVTGLDLSGWKFPCEATPEGCALPQALFLMQLGGLYALHTLNLSGTALIVDMSVLDLQALQLLQVLDLRHMPNLSGPLSGSWPAWLPSLSQLHLADLQGGASTLPLTWYQGTSWANMLQLTLSGCSLQFSTPLSGAADWALSALTHLDLSNNSFAGSLDAVVVPSLTHLDLSHNQFTGPITSVLPAAGLQVLRLSNNPGINGELTQAAPGTNNLFTLPLELLEAANCQLSGTLPDVTGSAALNTLQRLDLSGNMLQGSIPPSWNSFTQLTCLQLHDNPGLCGDVPDGLPCFDTLNTALGQAAGTCSGSTLTTTFANGLSSGVCRTPLSEPGCFPAITPAGSVGTQYGRSSGWTQDGRALKALGEALGVAPGMLSFPAPCAIICPNQPPPGPPGGGNGTAPGGNGTGPGSPNGAGPGSPNGTWPPPPPKLCFQCQPFQPDNFEPRISDFDLIMLAMLVGIPTSNLSLVPQVMDFTALVNLRAEGVPLKGTIPSGLFSAIPSLQSVRLSKANLQGAFPSTLGTNLRELFLDGNQLTGTLPALVPSTLQRLVLSQNLLNGSVPLIAISGGDSSLRSLEVDDNMLTGSLPSSLGTHPNLMAIRLAGNRLSGALPDNWGIDGYTALQVLDLSRNMLSGTLPDVWKNFEVLKELDMSYNNLTGTIPSSWMNKDTVNATTMDLKRFACAHCGLSGALPTWGSTTTCLSPGGLQFFDVSYNSLSGATTGLLNSFGTLQAFNISHNSLSGTLLASDICVTGFTQMLELRLSHNQFGGLPTSWSTMTSLKVLDASNNNLQGAFPGTPSSLVQLYLDHNNLTGQLPPSLGTGQLRCWSVDNNPGLCGQVPSGTPCFSPLGTNLGLDCATNQPVAPAGTCMPWPSPYTQQPGYFPPPYPSSPPPSSPPPSNTTNTANATNQMCNMPGGCFGPPGPQPMCDPGRIPDLTAQGRVLLAWRDSMRGWGGNPLLSSWGTGDPCVFAWGGVLCDNGTVVGIRLQPPGSSPGMVPNTWAQGPINWDLLTNLTSLRSLELQGLYDNMGAGGGGNMPGSSGGNMSNSTGGNMTGGNMTGGNMTGGNMTGGPGGPGGPGMFFGPPLPPLPDAFARLPNLIVLNISNSRFGSALPASWGNMTKLQVLDLSNTMSWGFSLGNPQQGLRSIPGSWCSMTALQVLTAQQAGLQGSLDSLPITGACMPSLRVLQLGGNWGLNGTLPSGWTSLNLTVLDLNQTGISGTLPDAWGSNLTSNSLGPSLQQLFLHKTQISGPIPGSWLFGLPIVTRFTIWGTGVCGLHPAGGVGLGSLCLDTTGTRLGFNCSAPWMNPITVTQQPAGCVPQAASCSDVPCSVSPGVCCDSTAERVLLSVKTAWGNPKEWSSWDTYFLPCGSPGWQGVECNWQGRVARLNFSGMGLSGQLPADVLQLPALELLDLSANSLSGPLPDLVSGGQRLRVLDLSRNMLTGTLPATWRNMGSLQSLDLSYNSLGALNAVWLQCGSPTMVWPCMGQLANFTCRSCGLTGPLPNSFFTANLTQLILPHNQLSGPITGPTPTPAGPSKLRVLDVSYNSLSDISDPSFWSYVSKGLQKLLLKSNAFSGAPLSSLPLDSSSITVADLSRNAFTSTLPAAWLVAPSKLEVLNLAHTGLNGTIPASGASPSVLRQLLLNNNPGLSGGVGDLQLPTSLQALHIAATNITGAFDAGWMSRQGPQLSCLVVYNTSLCGPLFNTLPCSVQQLPNGTSLNKDCSTGAALAPVVGCKNSSSCFQFLRDQQVLLSWKAAVSDTAGRLASWSGPDPCSAASPWAGVTCNEAGLAVTGLNVSGFGLQGPLPRVQDLAELLVVDLSNNSLAGTLPDVWASAQQLLVLNLSFNKLNGSLPASWAALSNLQVLDISGNTLQGGPPPAWGDGSQVTWQQDGTRSMGPQPFMWRLRQLHCNSCNLSGPLPMQWQNMDSLQVVSLARNNVTGLSYFGATHMTRVVLDGNPLGTRLEPMLASGWRTIKYLSMSRCQLVGPLPPEWAVMPLTYLDLSFNKLQGTVPDSWTQAGAGILPQSLQTLLLNNNQLAGNATNLGGLQALSCWSVASNWGLCGVSPAVQACGNVNGTKIGFDCMSMAPVGPAPLCIDPTSACAALLNMSAINPSGADMAGLLALKASVTAPACFNDSRVCSIFDTWTPASEPCQVANCSTCLLEHSSCGVMQPGRSTPTCLWRYVECTNGRLSKVVLDYGAVGSSGPQLTFGPGFNKSLIGVDQLEELHLTGHIMNDTSWPPLPFATKLKVLHLGGPGAPGAQLPANFSAFTQLRSLWLHNMSNAQGALTGSFSTLTQLQELRISSGPGIDVSFGSGWSRGLQLQWLELSNVNLTGPLAPLGNITTITRLSLNYLPSAVLPAALVAFAPNAGMSELTLNSIGGWGNMSLDPNIPSTYPNITRLGFQSLGLVGPIPAAWQSFRPQQLIGLYLSGNVLNGSLPTWLLTRMTPGFYIDLSRNSFTGFLPPEWADNGTTPGYLLLSRNNLTGSIPDNWANLVISSYYFDVSYNRLWGSLGPPWSNATRSPWRMNTTRLSGNPCLCGGAPGWLTPYLDPIPYYTALVTSNSTNSTGTNASSSTNGTNTTTTTPITAGTIQQPCGPDVDLACGLSLWPASFFKDVQQLLLLKAAAADNRTQQQLGGWRTSVPPCTNSSSTNGTCSLCDESTPPELCGTVRPSDGVQLCNWRYVECRNRRVVAVNMAYKGLSFSSLPPGLSNGTVLEVFDLWSNNVMDGPLPVEYASWSQLSVFKVSGGVMGTLPQAYSSWNSLRAFEVSNTRLNGTIPSVYFTAWPALENFTVDGAAITGYVLDPFSWSNLTWYTLQNTPVMSDASQPFWVLKPQAATLSSLKRLQALRLGGTLLQLPSWTSFKQLLRSNGWTQLKALGLPRMGLTGPIGPLSYYLPQLTMLDLEGNNLWGVIPPDLVNATGLLYLNLANNALYGTLPSDLAAAFAPFAFALDLSNNKLSGTLPDAWGSNTSTTFDKFNLSSNSLNGSLPTSWARLMVGSSSFDISRLQLSGQLPALLWGGVNATAAGRIAQGIRATNNTCLCGSVPIPFLDPYLQPGWADGTGLYAACPVSCTPPAAAPGFVHPDWPGITALKAAVVSAPANISTAINNTWSSSSAVPPCHDIDPNCVSGPWDMTGTAVPVNASSAPSFYCNAFGVSCQDGRVAGLSLNISGLVLNSLPAQLNQLASLQFLTLDGATIVGGSLPGAWSSLSRLRSVSLSVNSLSPFGPLPSAWSNLTSLQQLSMCNASFTDGLPDAWSALVSLSQLRLQNASFAGTVPAVLPASWSALGNLTDFVLANVTGLSGTLPSSWTTGLRRLTVFQLRAVPGLSVTRANLDDLLGASNASAGNSSNGNTTRMLASLALDGFSISGLLPALGDKLTYLSLANNRLQGGLSQTNWTVLTQLQYLNLTGNLLTGTLPDSWAAWRTRLSVDVSRNKLGGSLPAAWGVAGADGATMQLSLLDASANMLTGTLPPSYSGLSNLTATALFLFNNNLTGSIPAEWGQRNSSLWAGLYVTNNTRMCGLVPPWFYSSFEADGPPVPTAMLNGTRLGSTCRPTTFDTLLDVTNAYMPTVNRPLELLLISKTSPASMGSSTWQLSVTAPNATAPQLVGSMLSWPNSSEADGVTFFAWRLLVPGRFMSTVGSYSFSVTLGGASVTAANNPLVLAVYQAATAADASSFTVDVPVPAVGAAATVSIALRSRLGAPLPSAAGVQLTIQGRVTGNITVPGSNLTYASPGTYSYSHSIKAMQRLNFTVTLDGAAVGESVLVNITSVLPSVVNVSRSLAAATLQRDGDKASTAWTDAGTPVAVLAYSWHMLMLPVFVNGRLAATYADPKLGARLVLTVTTAPAVFNSSSNVTTPATTQTLSFQGFWSSSNGSYVVPFKLPVLGNSTGVLQLMSNVTANTTMGSRSISLTASQLFASASQSTVSVVPGAPAAVGDAQFIVASLLSNTKRPVMVTDNVRITATGSITGNIALSVLTQQTDNTWATRFLPPREETITVRLLVDNLVASQATLTVVGRSPTALDLSGSMQQATLTSQGAAVTAPVLNGTSLVAYLNETFFLTVPVVDKSGTLVSSDPGAKAVLSLVAWSNETAVLQRLGLNLSSSSSGSGSTATAQTRRLLSISKEEEEALLPLRMLLQSSPAPSPSPAPSGANSTNATAANAMATAVGSNTSANTNSTNSTTTQPVAMWDWLYMSDYAVEAVPDPVSLDVPPLPPNYTSNAGLGPDTGNPTESLLANMTQVVQYTGVFNSFKGAYDFQLRLNFLDTFLTIITLRHPNVSGSFSMSSCHLTITPSPAAAAAPSTATTAAATSPAAVTASSLALFNPLVNPQLVCSVTLPRLAAAMYTGGNAQLLTDFASIVAANAALDSPLWVQSNLRNTTPVLISTTVWFPSNYSNISSAFASLNAMDYFIFLLNNLPTVAFSSAQLPAFIASDARVSNCTITLPGQTTGVNISQYAAAASISQPGATASSGSTTAPAPALSVLNVAAADLQVVVATPTGNTSTIKAVDISKIVDTTPPVITMQGDSYMTVLQTGTFTDPGVRVYDNIDGSSISPVSRLVLCARPSGALLSIPANDTRALARCGPQLIRINTTLPSLDNETYVITYTARDAAGNQAAPLRRYVTVTARCALPERWCPDLSACSFQGLCLRGLSLTSSAATATSTATTTAASTAAVVKPYVPPTDTTPPKLVLLGSGRAALTATGAAVLLVIVPWKSAWQDPGATAVDAVDGDLTSSIQSFGAGAVDTSVPTAPGRDFGYVVEYSVQDKSRNVAPAARRLIRIVCPSPESYCIDPDSGKPTCTSLGVCGAPALLSAGTPSAATSTSTGGSTAAAAAAAAAASSSSLAALTAAPAPPPTPPNISLTVPGAVQIIAGDTYDRCADSAAITEVCERGATTNDAKDGNLDRQVLVCGNRWQGGSKGQRLVPVLLACGIQPDQPGEYNITFSVTASSGLTSTVSRKLVIKAACPEGEKRCPDKVTCSVGGSCLAASSASSNATAGGTAGSSSQTTSAKAAAAAAAAAAPVQAPNQPPNITLISILGASPVVHVRRGQSYTVCQDGVPPSKDAPCEPGAIAIDPDGVAVTSGGNGSTVLNLTSQVVVCPPARCISSGCSPMELQRHYLAVKGLQGCGIDTMAAEGTQFKVDFWVWDSGTPVLNATASRIVLLDAPCPDSSAAFFCTDSSGRSFCSGSPCGQTQKLLPPDKPKPVITLLPNPGPTYVAYGRASSYLGPCTSGTQTSGCGATAWDVQPSGKRTDLTALMTVSQTRDCGSDGSLKACPLCDLGALSASGACMPAAYTLTYSVANDEGISASVTRQLFVYQGAAIKVPPLVLYSSLTNFTQVQQTVSGLRNSTTPQYATGQQDVAAKLAGLPQVAAGDVEITSAADSMLGSLNYSISVNATVYLYVPAGVHRQDILASAQPSKALPAATAAGSSMRHLMAPVNALQPQQPWLDPGQPEASVQAWGSGASVQRVAAGGSRAAATAGMQGLRVQQVLDSFAAVRGSVELLDALLDTSGCKDSATEAGSSTCDASRLAHSAASGSSLITSTGGAAVGATRRLLQSGQGSQDMASVIAALAAELGANVTTQPLTPQAVDLLTVYMSALTSSVNALEQQILLVNSTSSTLATSFSQAFGDNAQQRDSQTNVQITQLYQALVTQFDAMVAALGSLADTAASKFDQQKAAATSLSAAMQGSITAMREAAVLAEQLQAKYVAQTVMLDAATGGIIEDWNCSRTSDWEVAFEVARPTPTAPQPASSRRLLQSEDAGDQLTIWQGYQLAVAQKAKNWAVDETDAPEQARYLGAAPGRNRLVAGIFLHTTRKTRVASCTGSSFEAKFDGACQKSEVPLARDSGVVKAYLSALFAGDSNEVFPYGIDPAFLRSSQALYKPELQGSEGWYYNLSDPAQVPPTTKAPYGFFHRRLQDYPSGFPVLLPNRLSQQRATTVMQYLLDGNYLDKSTRQLTAEAMTYNAGLRVLGYTRATFTWQADGAINGFIDVRAVPAVHAAWEGGSAQVASWLVPLWLLCVAFIATAAFESHKHIRHYDGDRHWVRVLASSGDCMLTITIAALMFVATVILSVFCTNTALGLKPQASYAVYDDITLSQAHMLMPNKAQPNISDPAVVSQLLAAATAAGAGDPNVVLRNGQLPVRPGDAGRWLLPDADGDWDQWAQLMTVMHQVTDLWAAYGLLQGIILVLLFFRLLRAWSFQSKLGIICNTIIKAAPQLAHLLVIILSCITLFALLSYIGLGQRVPYAKSYTDAFEETFRGLLGLGYIKLPDIFPPEVAQSPPEVLLSLIIYYLRELLFVMVFMQFFMATLGDQFMQLKAQVTGAAASGIPQDLAEHVLPELRAKAAAAFRHGGLRSKRRSQNSSGTSAAAPAAASSTAAGPAEGAASATGSSSAASQQQQQRQPSLHSAEAVLAFLKAHYPEFVSSKAFGDRVPAIKVGSHFLDLSAMQQLFAQLALQPSTCPALLLTAPARAFSRQAADSASHSSSGGSDAGSSAAASAAAGLPPAGRAAVEAGAPAAAVAAALAAAEQLLGSCGEAVDAKELQEARLELQQLQQLDVVELRQSVEEAGDGPEEEGGGLQPGRDYTIEDLQALLQQELQLHRQIYGAIWAAVTAMERWSTGVSRWQAKVTADTNSWLAKNAALIASRAGGTAAEGAAAAGTFYRPLPLPPVVDLSQSLRPATRMEQQLAQQRMAAAAAVTAAMGEYGAAVVITAGEGLAGLRAGAGLEQQQAAAAGAPDARASTESGSSRSTRPSIEVPGDAGAAVTAAADDMPPRNSAVASLQASNAGGTSIRSPGGVSLHARTPGPSLRQQHAPLPADIAAAAAAAAAAEGRETAGSSSGSNNFGSLSHHSRPYSAGRNQVVPLDADRFAAAEAAAAASGTHSHSSGSWVQQGDVLEEGEQSGEEHRVD